MDYLFWAYMLVWVLLFAYFIRLHIRQNQLSRQVEQLGNRLSELSAGDTAHTPQPPQ